MSLIDMVSPMVDRYGQSVVLRHFTANTFDAVTGENTQTSTDYNLKAAVREYAPRELGGLVQQGDRKVIIAADDCDFVPAKQDQIQISGKWTTIQAINARAVGDVPAIYIIQVRG